jgi:DNA-binding NtrC family response regulator
MARVLIIEDEANLRMLYQIMLGGNGYEIMDVGSGAKALEVLSHEEIDAVVLNPWLPDIGGLPLMNAILSRQPGLPIIITTDSDEFHKDSLMSWGAVASVVKSPGFSELKKALARFIPAASALQNKSAAL